MNSLLADLIVEQARASGVAFFKTLSANDVGVTKSHQSGFHIGIGAAHLFTPQPVEKGVNHEHPIRIRWTDGTVTNSTVKWYGKESRREYRITNFNRIPKFFYRRPERLGGVLAMIQEDEGLWIAHVLDDSVDVESVMAALGLSLDGASWTIFLGAEGSISSDEVTSNCEAVRIHELTERLDAFPATRRMSELAVEVIDLCGSARGADTDSQLLHRIRVEYALFRRLEERLISEELSNGFTGIEDFLKLAQSVLQRRKSRAGKALEWHLTDLMSNAGVSFEAQPELDKTNPDFVIPSAAAYYDVAGQKSDAMVVSVKTTCKDRWRQVLAEAPRAKARYLITLQQGISQNQMREIHGAGVRLVVPAKYHEAYAPEDRVQLLTISRFLELARRVA